MTEKPELKFDFNTPEEFEAACQALAGRLHFLNRVALGEQGYVVALADMLEQLGGGLKDRPEAALFGDGWTAGEVTREERPAAVLAWLYRDKET